MAQRPLPVQTESHDVQDQPLAGTEELDALLLALGGAHFTRTSPARTALDRALAAGGVPFEAVVGTPSKRLGARLTLEAGHSPKSFAAALGVDRHPWGLPDWAALRVGVDGDLDIKPYHRIGTLDGRFPLPLELPDGLHPVMAAEHRGVRELYLRLELERPWRWFTRQMLTLVGQDPPQFAPRPRPRACGFGVSLAWVGTTLTAVTVYASRFCLSDDASAHEAWLADMDPGDRRAYELAVACMRAMGTSRRRGSLAMLWWTFTRTGERWRAASLPIPTMG